MTSFHTNICVPLEHTANEYFQKNNIPVVISADFIETGGFITVMDCLLQHKFSNSPEVLDFLQDSSAMLGLPKHQILDEIALEAYDKFRKMFELDCLCDL